MPKFDYHRFICLKRVTELWRRFKVGFLDQHLQYLVDKGLLILTFVFAHWSCNAAYNCVCVKVDCIFAISVLLRDEVDLVFADWGSQLKYVGDSEER